MFYGSKEELLYHILLEEEAAIRNQILATVKEISTVTKEDIKQFLLEALRLLDENPLIRQMYLDGEFAQLVRKLPRNY